MRAVLVDPNAPGHLRLDRAPDPVPFSNQALVRVEAVSLNLGEVRRARESAAGSLLGWDLAGVVEKAAADGSGPPAGTRVVGCVQAGAWAELVAIDADHLAPIPAGVSAVQAATLPVAGLTALYSLEKPGSVLARSVLVTGASGGVGHFAVQLARLAGATVHGLVRREAHAGLVRDAGADVVIVGEGADALARHAPFHLVLDSVGGELLAACLGMLAPDGMLVNYGVSAGAKATIDARQFFRIGRASYYGLYLFTEFRRWPARDGLSRLMALVAAGKLHPHIAFEAPWTELGAAAEALWTRNVPGKAVLHVA